VRVGCLVGELVCVGWSAFRWFVSARRSKASLDRLLCDNVAPVMRITVA
jgi:hypothetical protein